MDLDFLLALQNGRSDTLAKILSIFTYFGSEIAAIGLACLVYWCFNRKTGNRLLLTMMFSLMLNQLLKLIFVARRPWIRNSEISPWGNSMDDATGYSFPSGHTANAAAIYGGLSMGKGVKWYWKLLAWLLVLIVGFSRLYLGVHTPQDVLVSLALGIILVFAMDFVSKKLEQNPKLDISICLCALILAAACTILVFTRNLPGDADEVAKNTGDIFKLIGACVGIVIGWLLERRIVKFEEPKNIWIGLIRLVVGLLLVLGLLKGTKSVLVKLVGENAGGVIRYFITCFTAIFLWPLIFSKIGNKTGAKSEIK